MPVSDNTRFATRRRPVQTKTKRKITTPRETRPKIMLKIPSWRKMKAAEAKAKEELWVKTRGLELFGLVEDTKSEPDTETKIEDKDDIKNKNKSKEEFDGLACYGPFTHRERKD